VTFHNPYFDPIESILIGILLAAVALLLGRETRALLIGERTNRARRRRLRQIGIVTFEGRVTSRHNQFFVDKS